MTDVDTSQAETRPAKKADDVPDMAALVFAELFYRQAMAERDEKRRDAPGERFDGRRKEDLE